MKKRGKSPKKRGNKSPNRKREIKIKVQIEKGNKIPNKNWKK